jgi:uncharacterized membrane protein YoaK (UPF0700 family)
MSSRGEETPRSKLDFLYTEILGEVDQLVQRLTESSAALTVVDGNVRQATDRWAANLETARQGQHADMEKFSVNLDKAMKGFEARWQREIQRSVSRVISVGVIAGATAGGLVAGALGACLVWYLT